MVSSTSTANHTSSAFHGWAIVTRLIFLMAFLQPFFIGLLFSGFSFGLDAHERNAYTLLALTLVSLVVALLSQRRSPGGRRLIFRLASLAVAIALVAVLGVLTHEGHRLQWIHFPAGVALIGMASTLPSAARGLYRSAPD